MPSSCRLPLSSCRLTSVGLPTAALAVASASVVAPTAALATPTASVGAPTSPSRGTDRCSRCLLCFNRHPDSCPRHADCGNRHTDRGNLRFSRLDRHSNRCSPHSDRCSRLSDCVSRHFAGLDPGALRIQALSRSTTRGPEEGSPSTLLCSSPRPLRDGDVVASYPNGAQRFFLYERSQDVEFVPTCLSGPRPPSSHLRTVGTSTDRSDKILRASWLG
jgi:hypothetical protein